MQTDSIVLAAYEKLFKMNLKQVHLQRKLKKFPNSKDRDELHKVNLEIGRFVDHQIKEKESNQIKML